VKVQFAEGILDENKVNDIVGETAEKGFDEVDEDDQGCKALATASPSTNKSSVKLVRPKQIKK